MSHNSHESIQVHVMLEDLEETLETAFPFSL